MSSEQIHCDVPGTVSQVVAAPGATIHASDLILVVEAPDART